MHTMMMIPRRHGAHQLPATNTDEQISAETSVPTWTVVMLSSFVKATRFHAIFRDQFKSQQDTVKVGAENPVSLGDIIDPESATCFATSLSSSSSRSVPHEWMIVMSHASLSIAQESGRRPSAKRLGYVQRLAQGTRKGGTRGSTC